MIATIEGITSNFFQTLRDQGGKDAGENKGRNFKERGGRANGGGLS